jgi:hypothetical protein
LEDERTLSDYIAANMATDNLHKMRGIVRELRGLPADKSVKDKLQALMGHTRQMETHLKQAYTSAAAAASRATAAEVRALNAEAEATAQAEAAAKAKRAAASALRALRDDQWAKAKATKELENAAEEEEAIEGFQEEVQVQEVEEVGEELEPERKQRKIIRPSRAGYLRSGP